jgi:hypothetical protein
MVVYVKRVPLRCERVRLLVDAMQVQSPAVPVLCSHGGSRRNQPYLCLGDAENAEAKEVYNRFRSRTRVRKTCTATL